jgi:hypothetical protein
LIHIHLFDHQIYTNTLNDLTAPMMYDVTKWKQPKIYV